MPLGSRVLSWQPRRCGWAVVALLCCAVPLSAQLRVARIIDGDTFKLTDGTTVRLIGIDAPETHPGDKLRRDAQRTGRDARTIRALGAQATAYADRPVRGRTVQLEYDPLNTRIHHRDRYGRTLAYVWVVEGGRRLFMVNRRLVQDGYAAAYTKYPFRWMADFLDAQRQARQAQRGLWREHS